MKKRLCWLIGPAVALVLELLPWGAVLNFMRPATDGSIGRFRETYSYFSLMPMGYGNFGPILTAILTCLLLPVTVLYIIRGTAPWKKAMCAIAALAMLASLYPLLLGFSYYSFTALLISVSLGIQWGLCILQSK